MPMKKCDFSGWATKYGILCSDGRTIMKDAFVGGKTKVPLMWQHQHDDIKNVLGHAILENRDEGVYAYCYLNDTDEAAAAKERVAHGDIDSLSIFANGLKHDGRNNVYHGVIRELSLVIGGANKGAMIDYTCLGHSDGFEEDEAYMFFGEKLLIHSDLNTTGGKKMNDDQIKEVLDTLSELSDEDLEYALNSLDEEDKNAIEDYLDRNGEGMSYDDSDDEFEENDEFNQNEEEPEVSMAHSSDGEETIGDVLESLNEKQKAVVLYLLKKSKNTNDTAEHSCMEEDTMGYNNVFDNQETTQENVLSHSDMENILETASRYGTLKQAVMAYTGDDKANVIMHDGLGDTPAPYGITNIGYLFPDYQTLKSEPDFIKRRTDWVDAVMNGVHHSPFARVKTVFADITADAARAKGYLKGNRKIEEVFTLMKRTTDPQTVYKKQKIDRDDMIDITSLDVVAYIKKEMRMMLNEELARAILVGDGRLSTAEDKISADHIRPVWTDDNLFTIKANFEVSSSADEAAQAKAFITAAIKAHDEYEGSGNITAYMPQSLLTACLLLEDGFGHALYRTRQELATKLLVNKIVPVPVMKNLTTEDGKKLCALLLDMSDYNVGADKGGSLSLFDDFDIDYNQYKYLIETRISGALTKAHSAIAVQMSVNTETQGQGEG